MTTVRIERILDELIGELHYLNAGRKGSAVVERLPIQRAILATALPDSLDAIVACSDLQGVVRGRDDESLLLGVAVAEYLEELAFDDVIPPIARIGVILAGDLYSVPAANKRGGHGDVAGVWAAFAERFAWVAGVAGNHDDISRVARIGDHVHLLDGEVVDLDGIRIGGVGGIIGNPEKPMRREEDDFLRLVDRAIDRGLDVLVLHEGPHGDGEAHQRGNHAIRGAIDAGEVPLTICGHDHWDRALATSASGQILNVDARVLVMMRQP